VRVPTSVDPREPVAPVMRIVLDEIALADIFVRVEDYSSIESSLKFSTFHDFRPSESLIMSRSQFKIGTF
jgi:hypothetical protein